MQKKVRAAETQFPQVISPEEWAVYRSALNAVRATGAPFLIGGAFALAVYTGRWRDTKDLDLLVLEKDRDAIVKALSGVGFDDYYDKLPYDRGWIYRGTREGFIVDVIWCMANRRAYVDELWFENARPVRVHNERLLVVPPEELLWHKLYVMQRERCDWPDILNLLNGTRGRLDWDRLLDRVGDDQDLLGGVLSLFAWTCPGRIAGFPASVRQKFKLPEPQAGTPCLNRQHIDWLDSRPWFAETALESSAPTQNVIPSHQPIEA